MASRHTRFAQVGEYIPYHIAALTTGVNTTSNAVSATGSQIVTPASMTGIVVGMLLHFGGAGAEDVVVTATTGTTFTATFANTHTNGTAITTPTNQQITPIGNCVNTSSATAITAGANVAVTPASMAGIAVGQKLNVANGTGTAEDVIVKRVSATTFTADFANNHSGTYTIVSRSGTFLGRLTVNTVGTSVTITLYNGCPFASPVSSNAGIIAVLNPALVTPFVFDCACDFGLFYTVSGSSVGDYTIMALDMASAGSV